MTPTSREDKAIVASLKNFSVLVSRLGGVFGGGIGGIGSIKVVGLSAKVIMVLFLWFSVYYYPVLFSAVVSVPFDPPVVV